MLNSSVDARYGSPPDFGHKFDTLLVAFYIDFDLYHSVNMPERKTEKVLCVTF